MKQRSVFLKRSALLILQVVEPSDIKMHMRRQASKHKSFYFLKIDIFAKSFQTRVLPYKMIKLIWMNWSGTLCSKPSWSFSSHSLTPSLDLLYAVEFDTCGYIDVLLTPNLAFSIY